MAESVIKRKAIEPVLKRTYGGKTFTFEFPVHGETVYAILFGRFGYDSSIISFSIISHVAPDAVAVKNFGTEEITATCTGHTVTVTTQSIQAFLWVYCPYGIIN